MGPPMRLARSRLHGPATLAALLYATFILLRASATEYNLSAFVAAGERFADPSLVPENLIVWEQSDGYDGQFYYRLALDPFTTELTAFGLTLDNPAYRQQRILYPTLVWLLSFGNEAAVPLIMVLVNYLGLCVIGWAAGAYGRSLGAHPLWGSLVVLYPGFLVTLARDLSEILEACFVLSSLLLLRKAKPLSATFFLTLAVLTKETALLVAAGAAFVLAYSVLARRPTTGLRWHYPVVPACVCLTWQLVLFATWNGTSLVVAPDAFDMPFVEFIAAFGNAAAFETPQSQLYFIELCFVVFVASSVIASLKATASSTLEKTAWLMYCIMISALGYKVWIEDWAFLRALTEFYLFGALIVLGAPGRPRIVLLGSVLLLYAAVFISRMSQLAYP
jgi:hypothetical protein